MLCTPEEQALHLAALESLVFSTVISPNIDQPATVERKRLRETY